MMLGNYRLRRLLGVAAGLTLAASATVPKAWAQPAPDAALYQAGSNAAKRLLEAGYLVHTFDGAPVYETFLGGGQSRNVSVAIPSAGQYVLLVGGDDDTVDLDVYFPQVSASDTTEGPTALIPFDVNHSGQFFYNIDMQRCQAANCGVFAVLLRIGD